MKNKFYKIKEEIKTLGFTPIEKSALMDKISAHISVNPLPLRPTVSPYVKILSVFLVLEKHKFASSALFLLLIISGGTCFAASYALPGDALYAVKINVNERVQTALTFGLLANVKVETEQANKRLEETEQLSDQGKITAETQVQLETNFKEHAKKITELVTDIKTRGDSEAADKIDAKFKNDLKVHQLRLSELSQIHEDKKAEIDSINEEVGAQLNVPVSTPVPPPEDTHDNANTKKDSNADVHLDTRVE